MMQKYQDSSLSPEERASDLLARMNLDEKFGQIQCYNAIDSFLGKSVEKQNPYGVGQVCILIATMLDDVGSAAGLITRLQKQIMESGKHHIPAIFHMFTMDCRKLVRGLNWMKYCVSKDSSTCAAI